MTELSVDPLQCFASKATRIFFEKNYFCGKLEQNMNEPKIEMDERRKKRYQAGAFLVGVAGK